ncbi:MAG TPA: glycosyltransferase [Longimicrobiales bacterium]
MARCERGARMRVAVCVATYRRPDPLAQLLESLSRLSFRKRPEPMIVVVVVDNDAAGSAREVVALARRRLRWPVAYVVEPEQGISHARNRAVAVALGRGADFVAFVDDDEVVSDAWLDELLDAQARYGADIVAGPAIPRFEAGTPRWVVRGRFFEHPRHATGTPVAFAATNNVLIAVRVLRAPEAAFDERFGRTGGEDTHFSMRARRRGARMVWADRAVVEDAVPRGRATARWILQRHFRQGNAMVWCERAVLRDRSWVAVRIAKAVGRIGQGVLLLPLGVVRGRAGVVAALCRVVRGVGALCALWGVRYEEYVAKPAPAARAAERAG